MAFGMGGLVLVGGAVGFLRRGSTASLMAGTVVGSLYLGSGWLISKGEARDGHLLAATTSAVLAGSMGARAARTGKMFPPGAIALLALASLAYEGSKAWEWRHSS